MIVNLIKTNQMYSLTLPQKVIGRYWLTDTDHQGKTRHLISVDAERGKWVFKSGKNVTLVNAENQASQSCVLDSNGFYNLFFGDTNEKAVLFTEEADSTRQSFRKIVATKPLSLGIGRAEDNNICFNNNFASSHHAKLSFNGTAWSVDDLGSRNGTYVNGKRLEHGQLKPGDFIFIMGLRIIVGSNFLAINNPGQTITIKSDGLSLYKPEEPKAEGADKETPETNFFSRSPRFRRDFEHSVIEIDAPPTPEKLENVPLALLIGPALTMAMTSVSTACVTVMNNMGKEDFWIQSLPTLLMAVSMLAGSLLWPLITKSHEKKARVAAEQRRQEKYLAYLGEIADKIKRLSREQSDILNENLISPEECENRILGQKASLWDRAPEQKDFLNLRLGLGTLPADVEIKHPAKRFTVQDDTLQNAMLSLAETRYKLESAPIGVSLTKKPYWGIYGSLEARTRLLETLILQMVTLHSYDELKIVLILDENQQKRFDFVRFIPHFWSDDKTNRFLAVGEVEAKEMSVFLSGELLERPENEKNDYTQVSPYYVIIAAGKEATKKCDAIKALQARKSNCYSVITATDLQSELPKETDVVIYACGDKSHLMDRTSGSQEVQAFAADLINESVLERLAYCLANTELNLGSQAYTLPSSLSFLEMFGVGKVEYLNPLTRWKENDPSKTLQTPVGLDENGELFNLDLHEKFHGPHGLVAGMTGSGKSEFIITYILSLAVNYHPDEVAFILIDYKGGGLTGAFEDPERGIKLPHLAGTITNLDGAAIQRSLTSLQSELRRRQAIFNEARRVANAGTMDIYKYQRLYREKVVAEPVPHLFIISDEFAELKSQQPEFMQQLISTARIGRSLGVHLILATQKPAGVVDDQIWSNSKFRVCLKVQDKSDSMDMIKRPDAAALTQVGRFYLQVGYDELFAMGQSAYAGANYADSEQVERKKETVVSVVDHLGHSLMTVKTKKKDNGKSKTKEIVEVVKYLSDLAREEKIEVRPLWLQPIPALIYQEDLERKYALHDDGYTLNPVIGELDDPFNQRQAALTLPISADGNTILYGSNGSGKENFLITLGYALIKNHRPEEVNLYIMDFGAETLKCFAKAPHTGDMMQMGDDEKIANCLKMLKEEMEKRRLLFSECGGDYAGYLKSGKTPVPNIVVFLNNFAVFSAEYEDLMEDFIVLTRDSIKYGIYFVITAANISDVRYKVSQNCKNTWTLQLNDESDYVSAVGQTGGLLPAKIFGRGLADVESPYGEKETYEFQTAMAIPSEDLLSDIRAYCQNLAANSDYKTRRVPVLPQHVMVSDLADSFRNLKSVPFGVDVKTLEVSSINLASRVIWPVSALDVDDMVPFAEAMQELIASNNDLTVWDGEKLLQGNTISNGFEKQIQKLFDETVLRNNTYKDAGLDAVALEKFPEKTYIFFGLKHIFDTLSEDGADKLRLILEKSESIYKQHFILMDTPANLRTFAGQAWYHKQISSGDGLWIGDGFSTQNLFSTARLAPELYQEIGNETAYYLIRGRYSTVKIVLNHSEEEA